MWRGAAMTMFSIGLMALSASSVCQDYSNKPVRIVTAAPGGNGDFAARLLAPGLTQRLGQQVIVDNRSRGVVLGEIVSKAPPDGHTLLAYGAPLWIAPLLQNAPYDPIADFAPITLVSAAPNILVVHPQLAASSVKELISLAKAKPGQLNYSSSSTGASPHLAAELFKSMAGVNIVRVPYKTTATEIADLIGGQVQLAFGTAQAVVPHVKSGRLRSLAVTSSEPTVLFPGLPTVAMTLPGYESVSMLGVFAPVKTPTTIINRLNQEIVRILGQTEIRNKFTGIGVDVIGSSPQEFTAKIKSEITRMGKVIKDAGIKAD